jgi:hypothetical protein
MAVQAFLGLGVSGASTRRANGSRVSRLFVSQLLWQLLRLYALEVRAASSVQAIRTAVDRHRLVLRLEGHGSLESISHSIGQLGWPFSSVGYLSPRLTASAQALPNDGLTGVRIVLLLGDESCTRGPPMLLTIAPRSLAILQSELVDTREAAPWKKPWEALAEAGWIEHPTVVAEQGAGVVTGCALMGLTHHPEVFPLLRPLAMCGERCSRQGLAAIAWEYARGELESGRAEAVSNTRRESSEAAKAAAAEKSQRYDPGCSLWTGVRKALAWGDEQGESQALAARQAEIGALLELRRA